jgi:hypothetical protein
VQVLAAAVRGIFTSLVLVLWRAICKPLVLQVYARPNRRPFSAKDPLLALGKSCTHYTNATNAYLALAHPPARVVLKSVSPSDPSLATHEERGWVGWAGTPRERALAGVLEEGAALRVARAAGRYGQPGGAQPVNFKNPFQIPVEL